MTDATIRDLTVAAPPVVPLRASSLVLLGVGFAASLALAQGDAMRIVPFALVVGFVDPPRGRRTTAACALAAVALGGALDAGYRAGVLSASPTPADVLGLETAEGTCLAMTLVLVGSYLVGHAARLPTRRWALGLLGVAALWVMPQPLVGPVRHGLALAARVDAAVAVERRVHAETRASRASDPTYDDAPATYAAEREVSEALGVRRARFASLDAFRDFVARQRRCAAAHPDHLGACAEDDELRPR